jgi:exodeoxyribonuclease VII large subunit
VRFRVEEVAVQGPQAVSEVTAALGRLDADAEVDVIVVTRGGGSLEDLLPFSNEALVRAVADCRTPVVSAIGHETDTPLLDLVADVRASTPTDAAKRVVPDVGEETARVSQLRSRGRDAIESFLARELAALGNLRSRPVLADPHVMLDGRRDDVIQLRDRARRSLSAALDRGADNLAHTRARVTSLSPAATLDRGYAVVQRSDGAVVRRPADVAAGDAVRLRLAEGELDATVR